MKKKAHKTLLRYCTQCDSGRGIWKRIDENREVFNFLKEHNVIQQFPFIEMWFVKQDEFLVNLCHFLEYNSQQTKVFPRTWHGEIKPQYLKNEKAI